MDDVIGESIAPRRLNFMLVSAFAFVALVLTAAGLYGVMAYVVAQRTREIGVRMALGATRSQVLAMMFRQAGTMTGLGIGVGVAGALLLTRSMTSLLFGVSAANPLVYVAVSRASGGRRARRGCRTLVQGHADRSAARAPRFVIPSRVSLTSRVLTGLAAGLVVGLCARAPAA